MRITVTAEDIAKGKRVSSNRCPIALAVRRVIPDFLWVNNWYVITQRGARPLSKSASKFTRDFDKARPVKPFKFILK